MKPHDDRLLSETIREGILRGTLPHQSPLRTWGGVGSGAPCTICGERITPDDFEYELEYAHGPTGVHVHVHCGSLWDAERAALESQLPPSRVAVLSAGTGNGNIRRGEPDVEHRRDSA